MKIEYQIIHSEMESEVPKLDRLFDLIVTSPPYADKRKKQYGGIPPDDYADWLFDRSLIMMDCLSDTGSLVVNIKEGAVGGLRQRYVTDYLVRMSETFRWVETFIWVKTNPYPTGNPRRLKDGFEYCFQFCKTKDYKFFPNQCLVPADPKSVAANKRRKNKGAYEPNNGSGLGMSKRITSDMARPSNVLVTPCHTTNTAHCAPFPLALPEFFINLMTEEGDWVLDPFLGSGTTVEAAVRLNRNAVGIEKMEEYHKLSVERLEAV